MRSGEGPFAGFVGGCGIVPLLGPWLVPLLMPLLLLGACSPGTSSGTGGNGGTLAGAAASLNAGVAGAGAGAGRAVSPRLSPLPPLSGDRLAARLTDLAGEAELQRNGKSLAEELQAFDTPYKLVSPYSGLRGEAALRVIEVAVADPAVETYPAPPPAPAPSGSEHKTAGPPQKTSAPPPKFDPVWNRFRGVYESKLALFAPAPSCYRFHLALPPHAVLSLHTAAVPPQKASAAATTAAVEFVVAVDEKVQWQQTITAGSAGRWLAAEIPLSQSAGKPGDRQQLSLCTHLIGSGPPAGVAVWGAPELWAEGEGAKAPNVLLILVDTLRADTAAVMPKLQEYAASSGVRFTQAITAATWTRPAVLALLGGDLPSAIGQNAEDMIPKERDRQRFYALDRHLLPRLLHEQGFKVAAIGNNFFLLGYPQIGLSLGFDEVADVRHPVLDSPAITRAAQKYFAQNKRRPFFLQLHYDAPHWPYSPPPEFLTKVPAREAALLAGATGVSAATPATSVSIDPQARAYLAEAAYADAEVAKVLAALRSEGLAERTLVVIFGDHGEVFDPRHNHFVMALKQPTIYHHGWSAYDEILRVPLVMAMPGRLPAGVTVTEQVRLTDVAPTVLEVLGLFGLRAALPGGFAASGQSLMALIQGEHEAAERPAFVEGQNVRALRAGGYLYMRRSDPRLQKSSAGASPSAASAGVGPVQLVPEELYYLPDDPLQHKNLLVGARDPGVDKALLSLREAFGRNAPPLPTAQLPVTHLQLSASGRSRVLAGVITSADLQLSVAGVSGGEVSPLGPGRLEVSLQSGGRLDLNVDADARLQLQLTLDGLPLAPELLLLGPYSLPLLHSGAQPGADLGAGVDGDGSLVVGGSALARLTAAYPPVPGERGDVLLWRDQASAAASAPLLSRSTQATQGEVATMMRDWGYAQPAVPTPPSSPAAPTAVNKPSPPRDGGAK